MTVPRRGSSIESAMMPPSMEPLAGIRLLLAGGDAEPAPALRGGRALAGGSAAPCGGAPDEVAGAVAADTPDAVVVLGGADAVAQRLDPLGFELGPVVLGVADIVAPGEAPGPAAARRLRAFV